MKYLLRKVIGNTGDWVLKDDVFYDQNGDVLKCHKKNEEIKLDNYWGIKYYNKYFNVFTSNSENTIYDYSLNKLDKLVKKNIYYISNGNQYLYYDRLEKKTFFSDFAICEGKLNKYIANNTTLFFSQKNTIKLMSFETLSVSNWQYTFTFPKYKDLFDEKLHEVKVKQLIGVLDNELYILFSGNRIVSIDVQTGKELCNIEDVGKVVNMPLILENVILDKKSKKLKLLGYLYIEIDTQTKQVQLLKNLEENTKEKIGINKIRYYEEESDLIYFIGKQPDDVLNVVTGVFNTKSLEFEWYERAPHNKYYKDAPQANNKYIGVQDNDNNLYLWERQEIGT